MRLSTFRIVTMEGDFVLVSANEQSSEETRDGSTRYLVDIDDAVECLRETLEPLNKYIHEHPELAFKEFMSHNALTKYMKSHHGWKVTTSAYGMDTAWVATYDGYNPGPVVSFNAEMGRHTLSWCINARH